MGRVLGIHHVAVAHDGEVRAHRRFADLLGLGVDHTEDVEGFIERMLPAGAGYIQCLESTGSGVIADFLDRRGNGLHHIGFEVDDIATIVSQLRDRGARLIDEHPRPGGMGTTIAFIHPSEFGGVLVELVQVDDRDAQ